MRRRELQGNVFYLGCREMPQPGRKGDRTMFRIISVLLLSVVLLVLVPGCGEDEPAPMSEQTTSEESAPADANAEHPTSEHPQ